MATCGLMSAPVRRYSTRADFGDGPATTRRAVVRLSIPQVALVGAQTPGTRRLYELNVGQASAANSGMSWSWPATNCRACSEIPSPLCASWKKFVFKALSQRLSWRWPLEPGRFEFHLAMNVAMSPWRAAICLMASLNSAALSAAHQAPSYLIAVS